MKRTGINAIRSLTYEEFKARFQSAHPAVRIEEMKTNAGKDSLNLVTHRGEGLYLPKSQLTGKPAFASFYAFGNSLKEAFGKMLENIRKGGGFLITESGRERHIKTGTFLELLRRVSP